MSHVADQLPAQASHTVILALALFSIGNTSESAQKLGIQQGTAPFNAAPDAPTHEIDLQILGIVLKGKRSVSVILHALLMPK